MSNIAERLREFGLTKLAGELGITHSAVSQWAGEVPPKHVLAVERITGISRYEQRPDVFGSEPAEAS